MTDDSCTEPSSDHVADIVIWMIGFCVIGISIVAGVTSGAGITVGVIASAGVIVIFIISVVTLSVVILSIITSVFSNIASGVSRLRLASRRTGTAAPLALAIWIGGCRRRWQAEDWQAALTKSPRPIRYSLGLVVAATRMRLYDLGGLLVKAACWVLATETRTWAPLTGLLLWGGAETTLDTGLGAAILTVVGAGAVFHTGVTWGRKQLGVKVRRWKIAEQPDSPADP